MTRELAIVMLTARMRCREMQLSGRNPQCIHFACEDCKYFRQFGGVQETREALHMAIEALKRGE